MGSVKAQHYCETFTQNFYDAARDAFADDKYTDYYYPKVMVFAQKIFKLKVNLQAFKAKKIEEQTILVMVNETNVLYENTLANVPFNKRFYLMKVCAIIMDEYYMTLRELEESNHKNSNHRTYASEENNTFDDMAEQLKNISKDKQDILKQLQVMSDQLKNVSNERNEIRQELRNVSTEMQAKSVQLNSLSKQLNKISVEQQTISKEKNSISEQLKNVSEQLSNMTKERNNILEQHNCMLIERKDISEQLKMMLKEENDLPKEGNNILEQLQNISEEITFYRNNPIQPGQCTITNVLSSYTVEPSICTNEMNSGLSKHIPTQRCNDKESINTLEKIQDTSEPISKEIVTDESAYIALPPFILNACYNTYTEWKSEYPTTKLESYFKTHLYNLSSKLFLDCATELFDVKKTATAEFDVIDYKWALIFSGALKQWQCQVICRKC